MISDFRSSIKEPLSHSPVSLSQSLYASLIVAVLKKSGILNLCQLKNAKQRTICFQIKKNSNFELSKRETELLKKKKKERHRYQYGFIGLPQWLSW